MENMNEIIYVLTNEAMPGYVKVGRTTNLKKRIRDLDKTGVPLPFECFYACTVKNAIFVEKQLHDAFLDSRVRPNREFFLLPPERVISALKLAEIENVTPKEDVVETTGDQQALNKARARRASLNFKMVGIPTGSELVYIHDESIKAKVVNNRQIEWDGQTTSLSASAQKLLGYLHSVQGTAYWMYEGETLDERRRRLESDE